MKKIALCLVITALFLSLNACSKQPIKIGFSGNLTGTGSELGTDAMYGAYIAVDEINAQGGINGRPVELIVKNDGNDISTAVEADKDLIDEGVVGIVGHLLSANGQLAIPYINEHETIMVSPTISSANYANQDDLFFTLMPISSLQAKALSETIIEHDHHKLGMLYEANNQAFSKNMVDDIRAYYEDDTHQVVLTEAFDTGNQTSYSQLINLLSETDLDALIIVGPGYDLAKFTQSFELINYQVPIYGPVWAMTNDFLVNAGKTANGVYLVNYFDSKNDSEAYTNFNDAYQFKYGNEPTFGSVFGYEATSVLIQGIQLADSTKSNEIKKALLLKNTFDGLQSQIEFNEYGDAQRDIFLFQVIDEAFEKVNP